MKPASSVNEAGFVAQRSYIYFYGTIAPFLCNIIL